MTEQEYIDVAELVRVRLIKDLLHEIAGNKNSYKDYATVLDKIICWEKKLDEKIKLKE